jgi:hypothetical protein
MEADIVSIVTTTIEQLRLYDGARRERVFSRAVEWTDENVGFGSNGQRNNSWLDNSPREHPDEGLALVKRSASVQKSWDGDTSDRRHPTCATPTRKARKAIRHLLPNAHARVTRRV